MLPEQSKNPIPTREGLHYCYNWYLDAGERDKDRYIAKRMELVGNSNFRDMKKHAKEIKYTASTGMRRKYLWGPNYDHVNKFFMDIVHHGERLKNTVSIDFVPFNGVNKCDISSSGSLEVDKVVILKISNATPIKELTHILQDSNILISPLVFSYLEDKIKLTDNLHKECTIYFNGSADKETLAKTSGFETRDYCRFWDGGATFYTCKYGSKHFVDFLSGIKIKDSELISTDYYNLCEPHLDYFRGDLVSYEFDSVCLCGQFSCDINFKNVPNVLLFRFPNVSVKYEDLYFKFVGISKYCDEDNLGCLCFGKSNSELNIYCDNARIALCGKKIKDEFEKYLNFPVKVHNYVDPTKRRKMFLE